MGIHPTARIFPWAKLVHDGTNLSIGAHSQIDDFTFLNAGKSCTIGRFVHIASFVSIVGGGEFLIEDFAGLSAGCRVITGTDDYQGPFMTNPTIPREFTNYRLSAITIRKHAIIGTNAVLFPGVTIGEGAAVGACTAVRLDLPAWGVYAGDPLRKIGERDRGAILAKADVLLARLREGDL